MCSLKFLPLERVWNLVHPMSSSQVISIKSTEETKVPWINSWFKYMKWCQAECTFLKIGQAWLITNTHCVKSFPKLLYYLCKMAANLNFSWFWWLTVMIFKQWTQCVLTNMFPDCHDETERSLFSVSGLHHKFTKRNNRQQVLYLVHLNDIFGHLNRTLMHWKLMIVVFGVHFTPSQIPFPLFPRLAVRSLMQEESIPRRIFHPVCCLPWLLLPSTTRISSTKNS